MKHEELIWELSQELHSGVHEGYIDSLNDQLDVKLIFDLEDTVRESTDLRDLQSELRREMFFG
jgi:hypothetical protein